MSWWKPKLPPRLSIWPTETELVRMARHPSAYCPAAEEVLRPREVKKPVIAMTELERTAMAAILAEPENDLHRFCYAERIKAQDPVRAAFIRWQLENPGEQTLDTETFAAWGARDVIVRRGFVEEMSLSGRSFVSLSDTIFAATPLRAVRLVAVNFLMNEVADCANLAKLRRLDLWGNQIGIRGVMPLVQCKYLGQLQELNLARNGLTDDATPILIASAWAKSVERLNLSDNPLTTQAKAQLRHEFGSRLILSPSSSELQIDS
jgi:hypothetical protein